MEQRVRVPTDRNTEASRSKPQSPARLQKPGAKVVITNEKFKATPKIHRIVSRDKSPACITSDESFSKNIYEGLNDPSFRDEARAFPSPAKSAEADPSSTKDRVALEIQKPDLGLVNIGTKSTSRQNRRVAFRIDLAGIYKTEDCEQGEEVHKSKSSTKRSPKSSKRKVCRMQKTPSKQKKLKRKAPVVFPAKRLYPTIDLEFTDSDKIKLAHLHNISTRSDFVRHCNSEFE